MRSVPTDIRRHIHEEPFHRQDARPESEAPNSRLTRPKGPRRSLRRSRLRLWFEHSSKDRRSGPPEITRTFYRAPRWIGSPITRVPGLKCAALRSALVPLTV